MTSLTSISCFVCNGSIKSKKKITSTSCSSSSDIITTISKLWGLSFGIGIDISSNKSSEEITAKISCCPECSRKLARVGKALGQFETLRLLLLKFKSEIEETINKSLDINLEGMDSQMHLWRKQIVQNTESKSRAVHKNEGNATLRIGEIFAKKSKPDEVGQSNLEELEILSVFNDNCGESDLVFDHLNENEMSVNPASNEAKVIPILTSDNDIDPDEMDNLEEGLDFQVDDDVDDQVIRLKCSKCRYTFKDEVGRDAHVRKFHEKGNDYPYFCTYCEKKFKTRRQLRIHVMGHNNEAPFICEHCAQGFRTEKLLSFHLKNKHFGTKDFKCTHCEKTFLTKTKWKMHEITHTKEYPIKCLICDKGFKENTSLKIHMVKHEDVNPWQCQVCEKYFSCSSVLKTHSASHTNEFKFKCTLCPFGGPSQSALDRHMISHSTEKTFQCDICSKTFKFQRSLQKHLQVHAGIKNYKCTLCTSTFIDKYKLTRHIKIHEGDKSFECQVCQKRFYTKDSLSSHMKYHAKQQATKEQEAALKLKEAKRAAKRRRKNRKKDDTSGNFQVANLFPVSEAITASEIISSDTNVGLRNDVPFLHAITSPDVFSGVFEFSYQDL